MAQSVAEAEKRKPVDDDDVIDVDEIDSQPKRLKQGRLPFKILDCKPVNPSPISNNVVKKRKLSGPDSPNSKAKQPKVPDLRNSAEKSKTARFNNDNEVSSSSEAENLPACGSKPRAAKNNLLDKFVRREDEITSTNDVIDLTETVAESEQDENILTTTKSPKKPVSTSPALPDKHVPKEKSEDHFARKLVFEEKEDDKAESASIKEESDSKANLTNKDQNENSSVDALLDSEEVKCTDLCENEEENGMEADKSADTSVSDDSYVSEAETSAGDRSNSKTPVSKIAPLSTSTPSTSKAKKENTSESTPVTNNKAQKESKTLSRKKSDSQQKLKEDKTKEKQMAKEQKEKEKLEKKRLKEEEKAEKERARQEEKEKKEKERLEKKEQAEREKQEKLQQREEEKKKKQELLLAKEEEKKKKAEEKEEEKKLKEEQKLKEEEDKQRQAEKRKAAFTSFFIKPKTVTSTKVDKMADRFIPFAVKKDMTLAPVIRHQLSIEAKQHLDNIIKQTQEVTTNFLLDLKQDVRKPVRTNRVLRKKVEAEQDVELLVHDEDAVKKSMHAVKLLQFHTDYRPPYYGTWTKKAIGLSPRNPWKKDESVFDYEVDSDDEWEEEEPGESLSDSNGEEEEGDEEDDGDEDGWMVPHGYLSEDEVCDEDEEVTPEALKARQRAKAQAWENELKAKRMMAPPVHFGCFLLDNPCTDAHHLTILKQFEMICLRTTPLETLISSPDTLETGDKTTEKATSKTTPGSKRNRKRALPEEAMPDLIRLVHCNTVGIKKLVREFRLYWRQKVNDTDISLNESQLDDDSGVLDKSSSNTSMDTSANRTEQAGEGKAEENLIPKSASGAEDGKPECPEAGREVKDTPKKQNDNEAGEEASDSCVSKRQLEMKIMAIAVREKREGSKKHCWYVNADILKQYNLDHLPPVNSWQYVSGDIAKKTSGTAEKKMPSNVGTEKKTPNKKMASKKNVTATEPELLVTPLKEKPSDDTEGTPKTRIEGTPKAELEGTPKAEVEGTPKSGKSTPKAWRGKEASAKKTPKDQPSIMAFTKKATSKHSLEDEKVSSLDVEIIDVDMEMDCEVKREEALGNGSNSKENNVIDDAQNTKIYKEQKRELNEELKAQISYVPKTETCEELCNMKTECVKQDEFCNPNEKMSSTVVDTITIDMETDQKEIPSTRNEIVSKEQTTGVCEEKKAEACDRQEVQVTEQSSVMNAIDECIVLE